MNNVKKTLAVAGLVGIALTVMVASPAMAVATLPTTDRFFAIPCDSPGDPASNLNRLDSDATSSGVGTSLYEGSCFADGSFSRADGKLWGWDWNEGELWRVDTTTGEQTLVGNGKLTLLGVDFPSVNAIFVDLDGNVYAVGDDTPSPLYLLSPGATSSDPSVLTEVGTLPAYISSMAQNPLTKKVYAQDPDADLFEVSLSDASELANYPTQCGQNPWGSGQGDCWGIEFDSNGTMWYQTDDGDGSGNSMLASASVPANDGDSLTLVEQGVFTDGSTGPYYSESTYLAPPWSPSLPNTGVSSDLFALATGVGLALVAAGGLLLARRRS